MEELARVNCENGSNRRLDSYGVTYGVPLPSGRLTDPARAELGVKLPGGEITPVQWKVTETWPDGSVRWLVVDFEMDLDANEKSSFALVRGAARQKGPRLDVEEDAAGITVSNEHLQFRIGHRSFSVFKSLRIDGQEMVLPGSDLVVEDARGKRYYAGLADPLNVSIIERGPQRVVVESAGRHTAGDGEELLGFRLRYTLRPNDPCVKLAHRMTNEEEPEMGVYLNHIYMVLPTALGRSPARHVRQKHHGELWRPRAVEIPENVELQAGSFVSEMAEAVYGAAHSGKVVIRNLDNFRENVDS